MGQVNIILMGPPGSGKGTQAAFFSRKVGVQSVSSGDLFRDNLKRNTDLGNLARVYMDRGAYVPDDVTIKMVMEWINVPEHSPGFLLDGFPRTMNQAKALEQELRYRNGTIDRVLFFDVPEEELVLRLGGRLICRSCQASFHRNFSPPEEPNVCDFCGGELYQRDDDKESVVKNRLKVYLEETAPVLKYYDGLGNLHRIDGAKSIDEVRSALGEALE